MRDYRDALRIPRGEFTRMTADDMDRARKARHERSTREVRGEIDRPHPFVAHLAEQAEALAELVDGSA